MRFAYETNRTEMMSRLNEHDIESYLVESERFDRLADSIALLGVTLADEVGCVKVTGDDDEYHHWWYLHRCPLGCLQLTTWDEIGPVGDIKVRTSEDLADWVRFSGNHRIEFAVECK